MDSLIRDISRCEILPAVEQRRLIALAQQGSKAAKRLPRPGRGYSRERLQAAVDEGEAARNRLVQSYLPMVLKLAKEAPDQDRGDAVSEGTLTLMKAIDLFDLSRGVAFSTYAYVAVQRRLWRFARDQRRHAKTFWQFGGDSPEPCDDDEAERLDAQLDLRTRYRRLRRHFRKLSYRERAVVEGRMAGRTLDTLAAELSVSRERIRQLEWRALQTLAKHAGVGRPVTSLGGGRKVG